MAGWSGFIPSWMKASSRRIPLSSRPSSLSARPLAVSCGACWRTELEGSRLLFSLSLVFPCFGVDCSERHLQHGVWLLRQCEDGHGHPLFHGSARWHHSRVQNHPDGGLHTRDHRLRVQPVLRRRCDWRVRLLLSLHGSIIGPTLGGFLSKEENIPALIRLFPILKRVLPLFRSQPSSPTPRRWSSALSCSSS